MCHSIPGSTRFLPAPIGSDTTQWPVRFCAACRSAALRSQLSCLRTRPSLLHVCCTTPISAGSRREATASVSGVDLGRWRESAATRIELAFSAWEAIPTEPGRTAAINNGRSDGAVGRQLVVLIGPVRGIRGTTQTPVPSGAGPTGSTLAGSAERFRRGWEKRGQKLCAHDVQPGNSRHNRRTRILLTRSAHALHHALVIDQDEVLHGPAKNDKTMWLVFRCLSTRTSSGTQPRRRPSVNRKLWGKKPRLCKQARYVTDTLPRRGDHGFCCTT